MRFPSFIILLFFILSCNQKKEMAVTVDNTVLQHICVQRLTDVIVHDIYAPPVAGRIYAYSNLAFYEAVRFTEKDANSIAAQLKGFNAIPVPQKNRQYNFYVAAVKSFFKTSTALVFSKDSMQQSEQKILAAYKNMLGEEVYNNSIALGDTIAAVILKRTATDNYKQTRGMPKYSVFKEEGKWEQTAPDYSDAAEPNWDKITPMLLDSAAQFEVPPPPKYSMEKNTLYYKELMELYNTSKTLTPLMDTIARYWDDNPFVTQHEGHLMYANKKTTPGGHWQGITGIVCRQQKLNIIGTARAYTLMSCAVFDAFIACWHEKFKSGMVRPITVIQNNIDADWNPLLQTPPFPEYTSGHSSISAAAATILTRVLGNNVAFKDTTEKEYLGLERSFTSVMQAAEEVSISRMYGGIHYRSALQNGFKQGEKIAGYYLQQIK